MPGWFQKSRSLPFNGFGKCWLRDEEMYCRYMKRPANELHADFTYTLCMTNAFKGFVV